MKVGGIKDNDDDQRRLIGNWATLIFCKVPTISYFGWRDCRTPRQPVSYLKIQNPYRLNVEYDNVVWLTAERILPMLHSDATDCRRQDTANELEECSGFKDFYGAPNSRAIEHEMLQNAWSGVWFLYYKICTIGRDALRSVSWSRKWTLTSLLRHGIWMGKKKRRGGEEEEAEERQPHKEEVSLWNSTQWEIKKIERGLKENKEWLNTEWKATDNLYMSIAFKGLKCFTIFLCRCMTFCAINFPSLPQTQQNPTLNWFMYSSVHFSSSRTSKKNLLL